MNERRKILQMLSCESGWYVRYAPASPGESPQCLRVIMWASVRDIAEDGESYDHVLPIVSGDGGFPMPADYQNDYDGVIYRPEFKSEVAWEEPR